MTARLRTEDGAALILALAFITLIGVATAVLANLAFSSQQAAFGSADRTRLFNALDGGVQAAIENARTHEGTAGDPVFGCGDRAVAPGDPATLPIPDPVNGYGVQVACERAPGSGPPTTTSARLRFTAVEAGGTPGCPQPRPTIQAVVRFSTIGASPTGARLARTLSWRVLPETVPTPAPVCPSP